MFCVFLRLSQRSSFIFAFFAFMRFKSSQYSLSIVFSVQRRWPHSYSESLGDTEMRMAEQKFESLKCEWQSNFRSLVHANMVLVHQRLVFPFKKLCFFVSARVREILFDCFLHIWYERSGSKRSERDVEGSPRRHTRSESRAIRVPSSRVGRFRDRSATWKEARAGTLAERRDPGAQRIAQN